MIHRLDWRTDQPVPLLKNVTRVTAPNPGVMTGPGTNCYVVGDPETGYIVIDPGPVDEAHQQRIWRAAGGDIRLIVCTHSHPDHSPGARPLQALCHPRPPILGLSSAPTARPASEFTPDRELVDGEVLAVSHAGRHHSLKAIHTPGHAANHVCLVLLEDGLLFSGDHVLNGSTTVVDPPDGDMTAYIDSLDRLLAACGTYGIEFICRPTATCWASRPRPSACSRRTGCSARRACSPRCASAPPARWTTGWNSPTPTCPRACGRWPNARCWPTCSASRPCSWLVSPAQRGAASPRSGTWTARSNTQRGPPCEEDPAPPVLFTLTSGHSKKCFSIFSSE